jgi:hypothetical protein
MHASCPGQRSRNLEDANTPWTPGHFRQDFIRRQKKIGIKALRVTSYQKVVHK